MRTTKSADLIGPDKFLSWRQLDGRSVTRPFLSLRRGVACETSTPCALVVVSRDITSIITQDAAPKNACGRGTGNKYIISHGLISQPEMEFCAGP